MPCTGPVAVAVSFVSGLTEVVSCLSSFHKVGFGTQWGQPFGLSLLFRCIVSIRHWLDPLHTTRNTSAFAQLLGSWGGKRVDARFRRLLPNHALTCLSLCMHSMLSSFALDTKAARSHKSRLHFSLFVKQRDFVQRVVADFVEWAVQRFIQT